MTGDSPSLPDQPSRPILDATLATAVNAPENLHSAVAPSRSRTLPDQIGHYTIIRLLGEGGMGTVYQARQENPDRLVALKVIKITQLSEEMLRRFGKEAQVLGRLQHPGIAQVFEAGVAKNPQGHDVPYFAMEFIQGVPLTDYCGKHSLGTPARLELLARICDAVYHAHQKGVIHRDLKPGNILVDETGQPKILDFGVARATDSDIHATLETDIGQLIGTVPYMSPEQVSGDPGDLDTRSDVYAMGVIAYELLAGRLPLDLQKKMIHEAARIIREEEPERLSSINRTLRGDIETIVAKALEKDKTRRYHSAEALGSDIRRYLRNETITARPASTWYQLQKFSRRNTGLVCGLAAALVFLVAGLIFTVRSRNQAVDARIQAVAAREDAEGFVTLFVDKVKTKFAEVGRLDAMGEVAGSVSGYYMRRGEASLDPEQLLRFGTSLQLSGEVAMGRSDLEAARKSFAEQQRVLTNLVSHHPQEGRYIKALGAAQFYLGLVAFRSTDLNSAELKFDEYLKTAERLVELDAKNPEWQLEVAYAHSNFVMLHRERGERKKAMASIEHALETKRELKRLDPANDEYARSLANSLTQLSDALEKEANLTDAEAAAKEAAEIMQALVAKDRLNTDHQYRLGISYIKVGELQLKDRRPKEALASFLAMQGVAKELMKIDPSNSDWRRELAIGHRLAAQAASKSRDFESARNDLAASRKILESLVQRDPKHLRWRHDMVSTEGEAAQVEEEEKNWNAAIACWSRARTWLKGAPIAADDEAGKADNTTRLAAIDVAEGHTYKSADDAAMARSCWNDAVVKLEPIKSRHEHYSLDMLARAYLHLGRRTDAAPILAAIRTAGRSPEPETETLEKQQTN